jgi:hypothetical protein
MHASTMQYLTPNDEQKVHMAKVREAMAATLAVLETLPSGRYKALAITALEESAMWANKGVTRDSDGSPREGAAVEASTK